MPLPIFFVRRKIGDRDFLHIDQVQAMRSWKWTIYIIFLHG